MLRNIPKIKKLIHRHSGPFVARVYQERDDVDVWVTHKQWMESRRGKA